MIIQTPEIVLVNFHYWQILLGQIPLLPIFGSLSQQHIPSLAMRKFTPPVYSVYMTYAPLIIKVAVSSIEGRSSFLSVEIHEHVFE